MAYKAVVLGGTGLIGKYLVDELIKDEGCIEITIIARRKVEFLDTKVKTRIIDFSKEEDYLKHIKGDVLFSSFGTTRAQAKSVRKHYLVDYTYQYLAAKAAEKNGIKQYVLVSSPWANLKSGNYYRKMKAELERDISKLLFEKITLIKPNGLMGKRSSPRFGERLLMPLFICLAKVFPSLRKHHPIEAKQVAKAMFNSFYKKRTTKVESYSRNAVLKLLKRSN